MLRMIGNVSSITPLRGMTRSQSVRKSSASRDQNSTRAAWPNRRSPQITRHGYTPSLTGLTIMQRHCWRPTANSARRLPKARPLRPAAEWLIDNYHLVEEQILQTRADLPPGFYRQLPKLAEGPLAGHPRIFGLVWAYVAHTDSHFDPALLTDFVNEYQQVQPLTIGELWAVAISLRLILIENLRRISQRIMTARRGREAADKLADQVLDLGDKDDKRCAPVQPN